MTCNHDGRLMGPGDECVRCGATSAQTPAGTLTDTERDALTSDVIDLVSADIDIAATVRGLEELIAARVEAAVAAALAPIEDVLPDECWVTRNEVMPCTDFIGGTFPNGAVWTADACCLPCRIRAALAGGGDRG